MEKDPISGPYPKLVMRQDLVAVIAPITDKEVEFGFRFGERDGNDIAVIDPNGPISVGGLVVVDWREVEEAAYLVLGLEHICPVCSGHYWAVCA